MTKSRKPEDLAGPILERTRPVNEGGALLERTKAVEQLSGPRSAGAVSVAGTAGARVQKGTPAVRLERSMSGTGATLLERPPRLPEDLNGSIARGAQSGLVTFGGTLGSSDVWLGLYGAGQSAYDGVREVCRALNWSWLKPGENVLIKVSCNSGERHPAVTSPTAVWAVCDHLMMGVEVNGKMVTPGKIWVADQAGLEWVRSPVDTSGIKNVKGSTKDLMQRNGLAAVPSGVEAIALEDYGYMPATIPFTYFSSWPSEPKISNCVKSVKGDKVDHIIYLPRLGSHAIAGFSGGLKCGVGWLDEESRFRLHLAGQNFHNCYVAINYADEIKDKHRLTLTLAEQTLLDFGPDYGTIYPFGGSSLPVVIASQDLARHDEVAWAVFCGMRMLMKNAFKTGKPLPLHRFNYKDLKDKYLNPQAGTSSLISAATSKLIPDYLNGLMSLAGLSVHDNTMLAYGETYGGKVNPSGVTLEMMNRLFLLTCYKIGLEEKVPWSNTEELKVSNLLVPGVNIPCQDLDSFDLVSFLAGPVMAGPTKVKVLGWTPIGSYQEAFLSHLKNYTNLGFWLDPRPYAIPWQSKTAVMDQTKHEGQVFSAGSSSSISHPGQVTQAVLEPPARQVHQGSYLERCAPEPTSVSSMDSPALLKLRKL